MKPVSPVVPGHRFPETIIAEHQDEYGNLPAINVDGDVIVTRWQLSWTERVKALFTGNIYLWMWTFGRPVTPVLLEVAEPKLETKLVQEAVA
jgi:hypothetical protein